MEIAMNGLRKLKRLMPGPLKRLWWSYIARRDALELENSRSAEEIFSTVYRRGHWGNSTDEADRYYSGSGSHDALVVGPYVNAVKKFRTSHGEKLDAVDLGCGDFAVGSQIRPFFNGYIACDVVPILISRNREKFNTLNVDFRKLDISSDPLPPGDIVFIRQVLQHLSNNDIQIVLSKVRDTYRYLVLSEHLPADGPFTPNMDHKTGRDVRLATDSGVVLTEPPFNLCPKVETVLCEVPEKSGGKNGVIRTTLYEL